MKQNLSQKTVKYIHALLKNTKITEEKVNTFTYGNEKIAFDLKTAQSLQDIIVNYNVGKEAQGILNKTYHITKLFSKILKIMPEALQKQTEDKTDSIINPVTKTLFKDLNEEHYEALTHIINETLSYVILHQISHNHKQDFDFSLIRFVELAMMLGSTILQWWINHHFDKFNVNKITFEEYCKNKNIIFSSKDLELWVQVHLKALVEPKEEPKKIHSQLATKIGSHFIEYLIKYNILMEITTPNKINYLGLAQNYQEDLILPSSFYKPKLDPRVSYNNSFIKHILQYKFTYKQKTSFNFDPKYSYEKTKALQQCIATSETKYCIKRPFFELYLKYNEEVNNLNFLDILSDRVSDNTKIIEDYIYITYQLEIGNMIETCPTIFIKYLLIFMQDNTVVNNLFATKFMLHYKNTNKTLKEYLGQKDVTFKSKKSTNEKTLSTGKYLRDYIVMKNNDDKLKHLLEKDTIARLLWDAYDKIMSQKFFMKYFLEDAYVFQHFDYFYLDMELTGVTRVSFLPYFLNYQSHRFSRSFLGYYTEVKELNEDLFYKTKTVFSNVLTKMKNTFNTLTYQEYCVQTTKAQNDFLLHFFKDTITLDKLLEIKFDSLLKIISNYLKYTKKANEALYSMSILHYTLHKEDYINMESMVFLDSTNSVTQHIASIFNNKTAATFGCLTGNSYNDINTLYLQDFNNFINNELLLIAKESRDILCLSSKGYLTVTDLVCDVYTILKIPKEEQSYDTFENFLDDLFNKKSEILSFMENVTFLEPTTDFIAKFEALTKDAYDATFSWKNGNMKENHFKLRILVIITDIVIRDILTKNSWLNDVIKSRDIVKPRIMPEAYGMTTIGGYQAICDAISKKILGKGIFNIDIQSVKVFAHLISSYFAEYFKPKHLHFIQDFLKLRSYLKYRPKKNHVLTLKMSTKYVTWRYAPKQTNIIRVNVARLRSKIIADNDIELLPQEKILLKTQRRFINVAYFTNELNKLKLFNSLCVHAIHTQETYVMTNWLINSQKLDELLKAQLNLDFSYTPNYDCFGTNFKYIVFLRYHIENSYNDCHDDYVLKSLIDIFNIKSKSKKLQEAVNFIQNLVKHPGDADYWDGTITNPYFVKH